MSTHLLFNVSCMSAGLFWPFLICSLATSTTESVSSISDMIYDSQWIDYPLELRKLILLMIMRAKKPMYFHGLKIVPCSLSVFLQVSPILASIHKNLNILKLFLGTLNIPTVQQNGRVIFRYVSQLFDALEELSANLE